MPGVDFHALAIALSNPKMFYAVNRENAVFQSQDGGKTWKELEK